MRSETLAIKSSMHSSCGRGSVSMFMRNEKKINGRKRGWGEGEKEREKLKKQPGKVSHAYVAFYWTVILDLVSFSNFRK